MPFFHETRPSNLFEITVNVAIFFYYILVLEKYMYLYEEIMQPLYQIPWSVLNPSRLWTVENNEKIRNQKKYRTM
jgi:hypothetical protein